MAKDTASLPPLKLSFAAGQAQNEDRAICLRQPGVALLAAFDGCGGVGGRRYPQMENRTGARIASGLYADCLQDWFLENAQGLPRKHIAEDLTALFAKAAWAYHDQYLACEASAVTGSMVRTLPSTAAIALLFNRQVELYWAGNTRAYLLSDTGLAQLSADDQITPCDAFESLYLDAPITNYLCADQPFSMHGKTVPLPKRGVLVLATDGAYSALPSPMHFEALLLSTLRQSFSKKQWKKRLKERLRECAEDDVTLILQPFGFRRYDELRPFFDQRNRHIRQTYILPADQTESHNRLVLQMLWELYRRESGFS